MNFKLEMNRVMHSLRSLLGGVLCLVLWGAGGMAWAVPLPTDVIRDKGPLGNSCNNTTTGCYGAAATSGSNPNTKDVIGAKNDFDVKSIQFTTWSSSRIVGDILFNYHSGDASLADWVDFGFTLKVGDLLFSGDTHKFGIALTSHNGFIAGNLYEVGGFLDSDQFGLNHNSVIWRDNYWSVYYGGNSPTPAVRMDSAAPVALLGAGTAAISHFNEGLYAGGIELKAHLDFDPGGLGGIFWQTYLANGGLNAQFASAICANDMIAGTVVAFAGGDGSTVPEPSTWLLLGSGLAGLAAWRRKTAGNAKP